MSVARLTADASDDFGVTTLTFFDGDAQIGTVTAPANSVDFPIPDNAACGERTLSVVVSDYLGQTASGNVTINVVDPKVCGGGDDEKPPVDPGPAGQPDAPSVTLAAPAEIGPGRGARSPPSPAPTARAAPTSPRSTSSSASACSAPSTAAPFSCGVLPVGREVGTQALRAVVTDSERQTGARPGERQRRPLRPDRPLGRADQEVRQEEDRRLRQRRPRAA